MTSSTEDEGAPGSNRPLAMRDEMLEALSDAAFEAVFIHRDGVIQSANRAAHELGAIEPGGLVGRPLVDFIPADVRHQVLSRIEAADDRPYESAVLTSEGVRVPVEVRARTVPVQLEGGPARVVALRDLREKRQLEEQVRNARKMEAVGRLAGGIAHDFNNLLTVMLAGLDLLSRGLGPDHEQQGNIVPIREAAGRAAELTKQLLTLARRQVWRPQVVDVAAVVDGLAPMLRHVVGEHVELEIETSVGACIEADPMQLEMVLINLAVNARDAMASGGRLTVEAVVTDHSEQLSLRGIAAPSPPHVCLVVTDTGHGMDAATRERVFEPFYTSKTMGEGTGLGLATVFSIVEQSGGVTWVDSQPQEGASFTAVFSRVDEQPVPRTAVEQSSPRGGEGYRLLLVEDRAMVRDVLVHALVDAGHDVEAAAGPEEALDIAKGTASPPDLVVTDVVMPGMNGVELVDRLRRRWPTVPVLFMSGYDPKGLASRAVGIEGSQFLPKPVTVEELLEAVDRCVSMASPDAG